MIEISVFFPATPNSENLEYKIADWDKKFKFDNIERRVLFVSKEEEFMTLIRQSKSKIMMAWKGGCISYNCEGELQIHNSSVELVKMLHGKWDIIQKQKPVIIGSSDITFLLCLLQNHRLNCFYGPNFYTTLLNSCPPKREITLKYLFFALENKRNYVIDWTIPELCMDGVKPWTIHPGKANGRLIGGNLTTLADILKEYKDYWLQVQDGDILFIEDNNAHYGAYNNDNQENQAVKFTRLKSTGVFMKIGGLIIGKTNNSYFQNNICDNISLVKEEEEQEYILKILEECVSNDIPIIGNVSCGHTHPMVTLPLGRMVSLDADKKTLKIL